MRIDPRSAVALAILLALAGCGPFGDEPRPGLWVVGADGTGAHLLVDADPVEPSEPSWSPDGRSIAYAGAERGVPDWELENDILVKRLDGGAPVNLTAAIDGNCIGHAWSPDGSRVAVLCSVPGGSFQLWSVTAGGANPAKLAETGAAGESAYADVAWAPVGNQIAFIAAGPAGFDLFVVGADGSGLKNLTADRALDRSPVWSSDGSRIAFISGELTGGDPIVVSADGTGRRPLASGGTSSEVSWQPGGDAILFDRQPIDASSAEAGIWTVRADGTGLTRLVDRGSSPVWSPNGDRIAFIADGIRVAQADGTAVRRVASGSRISRLAWSPDGTRIAFDRHAPWD
jgi:Tol biopolymer transport system component